MGRIQAAGYPGKFVFQEYIEGDDDSMYIFSAYCDHSGRVRMTSGGRILMHDRTPELIGNYNAITDARDDRLTDRLRDFLEKTGFVGICHFDVQYDARRGDYVVFEINSRQGRSNYYMTASGMNYLRNFLVNEYIYNKGVDVKDCDGTERAGDTSSGPKPDYGYAVANKPFIVSNVSRRNLIAVGREKVDRVPKSGLYWSPARAIRHEPAEESYHYEAAPERSIMRSYRKYNRN